MALLIVSLRCHPLRITQTLLNQVHISAGVSRPVWFFLECVQNIDGVLVSDRVHGAKCVATVVGDDFQSACSTGLHRFPWQLNGDE
jgi:hypothetical protein